MKKALYFVFFAMLAMYFVYSIGGYGKVKVESDERKVQESGVNAKVPKYTPDDAMKELEWWARTVASYPERAENPDFSEAVKIANQLYNIKEDVGEIAAKFPDNEGLREGARKILEAVPAVQKRIFPKLRRAWVNGQKGVMSEYGVRVSCGGERCDKVTFTGARYYSDGLAQEDYGEIKSQAIRLRFKRVTFSNGNGKGGFYDIEDQSDLTVE